MENWGLVSFNILVFDWSICSLVQVTYRTTAVLFDEKTSDTKYKNRIAYVVAHELAHQWFGNLVTMDWWSELWLNEGFATWVGWLATDHFHPDWCVWDQFVAEGMQTAFQLDSLRSSHPIEVPVKDALDVDQIFDHISYLKGSSVIRMLATHLGQKTFLKGVSDYLKAHAYGNATTQNLWSALSEASGLDVKAIIDPWITKIGYPVLTINEEPGQISIKQSRYLSTGDVKPGKIVSLIFLYQIRRFIPRRRILIGPSLTSKLSFSRSLYHETKHHDYTTKQVRNGCFRSSKSSFQAGI